MKKKFSFFTATLLLSASLYAFDADVSVGVHDFMVTDIANDFAGDGISGGTSHTLGFNFGVIAKHTTPSNIHFLAKAEAFVDRDKDHLDPDHIPVWFDFLFDVDGVIYKIDQKSRFKWYVLMDNKQNTVSCVERQVRQHVGAGYELEHKNLKLDLNAYLGFYYIEFDDDTPVARGYTRQDTDEGEASHIFEAKLAYKVDENLRFSGYIREYAANTGGDNLERDFEFLAVYKNAAYLRKNSSLVFEIKHSKYNLDAFFRNPPGRAILPFDNDTLIQASVRIPWKNLYK